MAKATDQAEREIIDYVVRIVDADGEFHGCGCLLSPRYVITCAHVVRASLGLTEDDPDQTAIGKPVSIKLGARHGEGQVAGSVKYCTYGERDGKYIDLALIELADPVETAGCCRLAEDAEWDDTPFRLCGFKQKRQNLATPVHGFTRGDVGYHVVFLELAQAHQFPLAHGFSGTPVFNAETCECIGLQIGKPEVKLEDAPEIEGRVGYMLPASTIIAELREFELHGTSELPRNPYKGLERFDTEDKDDFFGREAEAKKLYERVLARPIVPVIGSSGVGKSSLIYAGLIPRLGAEWVVAPMRPGSELEQRLATVLLRARNRHLSTASAKDDADDRFEQERSGLVSRFKSLVDPDQPNPLLREIVAELLGGLQSPDGDKLRLLLFVDQFEEIFTQTITDQTRDRFISLLRGLREGHEKSGAPRAVLAMRSDFYGQYFDLGGVAEKRDDELWLAPMHAVQLQQALEGPADAQGVSYEKRLPVRIVTDVGTDKGSLPILEFVLEKLWDKQRHGVITMTAYEALLGGKGPYGFLADFADAVIEELNDEQEEAAKRVFQKLVVPAGHGRGSEDTRRVEARSAFTEQEREVIDHLASRAGGRLLLTDESRHGEGGTVEVVHEELIRSWGRLQEWVNEIREYLLWRDRALNLMKLWQEENENPELLLPKAMLDKVEAIRSQRPDLLTPALEQYIRRSHARSSDSRKRTAEAKARRLATKAEYVRQARPAFHEKSVLLAVEAARIHANIHTDSVLRSGLEILPTHICRISHQHRVSSVAFSPDGTLLATASTDGTARVSMLHGGRGVCCVRHEGPLISVAFSPDGALLATASADNTARVCRCDTGEEISRIRHASWVRSVAFSPDATLLATASDDHTARIWRVDTGEEVWRASHVGRVNTVAFSPARGLVAMASVEGSARVCRADSGVEVCRVSHEGAVHAVAFTSNGAMLATASDDNTACVWRVDTGEEVCRVSHEGPVYSAAFSPDGTRIITASSDGSGRVWIVKTGEEVCRVNHEDRVDSAAFSPDGSLIATASRDMTARVCRATTPDEVHRVSHRGWVRHLAFSPDSAMLATASYDGTSRVSQVDTTGDACRVRHRNRIISAGISPDAALLAIDENGEARISKADTGEEICNIPQWGWVHSVAFSPDSALLATFGGGSTARVVRTTTGKEVCFVSHAGPVIAVAFSPDSALLATASYDNSARVHRMDTGEELHRVQHDDWVVSVSFSPNGALFATASHDGTARVHRLATGEVTCHVRHQGPVISATFNPLGKYLATGSYDNSARVYNMDSDEEACRVSHQGPVNSVTMSPDGGILATASDDRTARLWKVETGEEVCRVSHEGPVNSVAFSPDGVLLATASNDGTARVWRVTTGEELCRLSHETAVLSVAFRSDGTLIVCTVYSNTAGVHYVHTSDLIKEAQRRLSRNLTQAEWREYFGEEPYRKTVPWLPEGA